MGIDNSMSPGDVLLSDTEYWRCVARRRDDGQWEFDRQEKNFDGVLIGVILPATALTVPEIIALHAAATATPQEGTQ